jgi:uncharacterized protein YukE
MPDILGSRIQVPPELEASGPKILAIGVEIFGELAMLRKMLAPLAEAWTGEAAIGHENVQVQWDSASTKLMTDLGTLGDLGTTQNHNYRNYVDMEAANAASWRHSG